MKTNVLLLSLAWGATSVLQSVFAAADDSLANPIPKSYNVVWDSPSPDAWESMPLSGRLGAGANVWVQDGSLWFYLAHNEAYDEDGRLLKLGALRLTPANGALQNPASFKQELDLASGAVTISVVSRTGESIRMKTWFAGENLVVESVAENPSAMKIEFGTWRDVTRDNMFIDMNKRKLTLRADHVNMDEKGIVWFHRNADYPSALAGELKAQPWAAEKISNPAENNVFGGAIVCDQKLAPGKKEALSWQKWKGSAWSLTAAESKRHTIVAALRAGRKSDPARWHADAKELLVEGARKSAAADEAERWREFWERSHVVINKDAGETDKPWLVGRNYQLFRYMLACNRGGKLPLLFNGGIFTTDNFNKIKGNNNDELNRTVGGPSTPDHRHWMFCRFMAQNQRWLGWPTILAGDADLLEPSNAFYRMHAESAAARAKGLGAQGVVYPEPIGVWGLSWWAMPSGQCRAPHLQYAFAMALENAWMALHGHANLGKDIRADMDWIKGTVRFFDSYYRKETKRLTKSELGKDGKLSIYPANAIELLIGARNPIEVVAGLRRICGALLELPDDLVSSGEKEYFRNLLAILPELPMGRKDGKPVLLPAASWKKEYNLWELPELYAAWPYRMHSVTRPGTTEIAQNTWALLPEHRKAKVTRDYSWMPVVVNMAAIGNTPEAARRVIDKLSNTTAPQARFPAFFGPGHDWVPDHNWGGSGMVGLQEMLFAADPYGDGRIHLLPAWPKEWDVSFKLHAPRKTTVEASVKDGKVVALTVTPETRRKDVVVNPIFHHP